MYAQMSSVCIPKPSLVSLSTSGHLPNCWKNWHKNGYHLKYYFPALFSFKVTVQGHANQVNDSLIAVKVPGWVSCGVAI